MKEIIILDKKGFEEKEKKIIHAGAGNFHVVADFDRTLTKAFVDGQKSPTAIAQIRNGNYLGEKYVKKANELYDKYHPFEIDPLLNISEKREKMKEWWTAHHNLLIERGLTKEMILKIVSKRTLKFREGVMDFFDSLYKKRVPMLIFSAGPGPMISEYLKQEGRLYEDIHTISNNYLFDKNGRMVGFDGPVITSMNKSETSVNIPQLKKRKNVLLLGDSVEDLGMVEGFEYDNIIKIGFLNENVEEQLELFKKNFDVVILGDGDFSFVNDLVEEIK